MEVRCGEVEDARQEVEEALRGGGGGPDGRWRWSRREVEEVRREEGAAQRRGGGVAASTGVLHRRRVVIIGSRRGQVVPPQCVGSVAGRCGAVEAGVGEYRNEEKVYDPCGPRKWRVIFRAYVGYTSLLEACYFLASILISKFT